MTAGYINDLAVGDSFVRDGLNYRYTVTSIPTPDSDGDLFYGVSRTRPDGSGTPLDTNAYCHDDDTVTRAITKGTRVKVYGHCLGTIADGTEGVYDHHVSSSHPHQVKVEGDRGYRSFARVEVIPTERTFTEAEVIDLALAAAADQGWCRDGVRDFLAARGITLPVEVETFTVTIRKGDASPQGITTTLTSGGYHDVTVTKN